MESIKILEDMLNTSKNVSIICSKAPFCFAAEGT